MNLRNTVLTAALLSTLVSPFAHAGTGFSGLSPSETVALSVVLSPVLIVGGGVMASQAVVDASGRGIKASTGASGRFSENLSTHTEWTVIGMRNEQGTTQMDLESSDGTMRMTIGVPTSETNARGVRLQDRITMKKLGTDSFTAEHHGKALGVISDPAAKLAHSHKRN